MSRQLFEDAKKVLLSEATKLDPVGQEDKDIDNDGDSDKTDSYLKKRRGAISAAIAQSKNESVELSEEDAQRISAILKGLDEELKGEMHPEADKVLKHIKPEYHRVYKPHLKVGVYKGNYADRSAVLSAAEKAGHTIEDGVAEETELDEGSGPKETQKTPYRDINSPESRAAAAAQHQKMADAVKAEPGKKLLGKITQRNEEVVVEGGIEQRTDPRLKRASFLPPAPGTYAADLAAKRYKSNRRPDAKKSETMKNEEAEQLDELGNTPGGREALLAVRGRAIANRNKDLPDHYTPRAMKAQDTVNKVNDRLSGNRTKRLAGPGNPDDTPYTLGGRDRRSGRSWSEEVEQVDERVIKGKAQSAPQKEDVDLQEYELIEKFNVNIPEMPSYQDYVNAALKIAECKSFSELSEEDQEYIMNELEEAVATNDVSFILEAEAMSDMNDTVQRLRKAGHKVEDMGRDYKGNPFYVYIDKTNNMRRKVTYKGMQKMTQNMGRVQPKKEED